MAKATKKPAVKKPVVKTKKAVKGKK